MTQVLQVNILGRPVAADLEFDQAQRMLGLHTCDIICNLHHHTKEEFMHKAHIGSILDSKPSPHGGLREQNIPYSWSYLFQLFVRCVRIYNCEDLPGFLQARDLPATSRTGLSCL